MTKKLFLPPLLGIFMLCFSLNSAYAQFDGAGTILRAGVDDSNILLTEYFKPLGKGFGTDLNAGWFSTAKTHRTLGFDITVNASVAMVPSSDELFNVQNLNFNELEYIENQSTSPMTPTAFGSDQAGTTMGAYYENPMNGNQELLYSFEMPQGSGYPYVPSPTLQASVGIIKDTDVTLRFMPPLTMPSDVELGVFGVGIKHGLNQWLPGGSLLPVDLSLQAGYTTLNSSVAFDIQPESGPDVQNDYDPSTWEGQKAEFTADAFTANALIGKTLPIISVWAGVGYESSTVNMGTPGAYPITVPNENYDPNDPNSRVKEIDRVDNPIDIKYDNESSFHALVGTRIKLLIFNFSASYTLSKYPVLQAGFGIGIR